MDLPLKFSKFPSLGTPFYSGYHDAGYVWSTTSTTFTDMTISTTGNFITRQNDDFGPVVTAGSSLPGISFTPPDLSASYLVNVNASAYENTPSVAIILELTDGENVIATGESQNAGTAANIIVPLTGLFIPRSISPVTLKLIARISTGASTGFLGAGFSSAIEWTLLRVR